MKWTPNPKQNRSLTLKLSDSTDIKLPCQVAIKVSNCSQFLSFTEGGWPSGPSWHLNSPVLGQVQGWGCVCVIDLVFPPPASSLYLESTYTSLNERMRSLTSLRINVELSHLCHPVILEHRFVRGCSRNFASLVPVLNPGCPSALTPVRRLLIVFAWLSHLPHWEPLQAWAGAACSLDTLGLDEDSSLRAAW